MEGCCQSVKSCFVCMLYGYLNGHPVAEYPLCLLSLISLCHAGQDNDRLFRHRQIAIACGIGWGQHIAFHRPAFTNPLSGEP